MSILVICNIDRNTPAWFNLIIKQLFKCLNIKGKGDDNMTLNLTFKALSDPTRRKILDLLMDKDLTAGEIADHFQMTKPAISHHLGLLKQGDLVWDERQGQHVVYSINTTVLQEVMKWFMQFNNNKGKREEQL